MFYFLAIGIVLLDQLTKGYIQATMYPGESTAVLGNLISFTYVLNPGGAFGLFPGSRWMITGISAILISLAVYKQREIRQAGSTLSIAITLGIAGALGNMIDRIRLGEVIDFIDLGFWPVFNVADIAVISGVVLIILRIGKRE